MEPKDAIRAHFSSDLMTKLGVQFNVSYQVEDIEVLGEYPDARGTYRITFAGGEVSDWNIQFDLDNGELIDAYCYNTVIGF